MDSKKPGVNEDIRLASYVLLVVLAYNIALFAVPGGSFGSITGMAVSDYSCQSGLTAYYGFDEESAKFTDGKELAWAGPGPGSGKYGSYSMKFDGVDDYLSYDGISFLDKDL